MQPFEATHYETCLVKMSGTAVAFDGVMAAWSSGHTNTGDGWT